MCELLGDDLNGGRCQQMGVGGVQNVVRRARVKRADCVVRVHGSYCGNRHTHTHTGAMERKQMTCATGSDLNSNPQ